MSTPILCFYPEGNYSPLEYVPFLDENTPVYAVPPAIEKSINHFLNGEIVHLNGKTFIAIKINEDICEKIITNNFLVSDFLEHVQQSDKIVAFLGANKELIRIATYFRFYCDKSEIHYHWPTIFDVFCRLVPKRKSCNFEILRMESIISCN